MTPGAGSRRTRVVIMGADFALLGPARTMLRAEVPVIAVSAVRTGAGKSPTARWLAARSTPASTTRG